MASQSGGSAGFPWSTTNLPWQLKPGEGLRDNMPAGVPVYNVKTYTSSTDVATCLAAIEAAVSTPGYAYFPAGTYTINLLKPIGTNFWYGYANSSREIMGLIGDGADQTFIVEGPNMVPSDARAYALAPTDTSIGVPLMNIQLSNTQTSVPVFVSGISFDGRFQGPYGVPASSGITVNAGTPSPIPHRGLVIQKGIAGARVQFCRFRGFAYTCKASPPYELAGLETNNDNGTTIYRIEIDGRETSTGAVSAGGYMENFCTSLTVQDSWLHDTRRSGFAIHEHFGGDGGTYNIRNFQVENIATTADGFAGSSLGFNASNVEEVSGTMTYTNCRFALDRGRHITLGTTSGGLVAQAINVNDFISESTTFGGCLVIRIIKTPNSQGNSPWWDLYSSGGLAALPFTVKAAGKSLTPVDSGLFNASVHTPDKYYVVVTS